MKKELKYILEVALLFLIILISLNTFVSATDYYISSGIGSDSFSGTTPSTPWKTISKVQTSLNSKLIKAGDTVHLQKESTFSITELKFIDGGSLSDGYITIRGDDYGSGTKPVLNVVGGLNGIYIQKGSYINLHNFIIDGNNRGIYSGVMVGGGEILGSISNIKITNLTIRNMGNSAGSY